MSMFQGVPIAPPNAIFHVKTMFAADPSDVKMNLGVGAYRDDDGKPWVLPCVKAAERQIEQNVSSGASNHEYLPITGNAAFCAAAAELALGADSAAIKDGRVAGVQALSGTGALRLAGEFLAKFTPGPKVMYMSDPTWANHPTIYRQCGFELATYRYYKEATRALDFEGMVADLSAAPERACVLLHACAHNPTGVDPSPEQWGRICEVVKARKLFPIFDSAYQGFATGDLAQDAFAIRHFASQGVEMFVTQSFSKNFGLYNERAGALTMVASSERDAQALKSQVALVVRPMYSNPPNHGAQIVATTLSSADLTAEWHRNIVTMSSRIGRMRKALYDHLVAKGTPGTWEHIINQIGMFSYTGLSKAQVDYVQKKHSVYMLSTGRISMCGVTDHNAGHLAMAIDDAVRNVKAGL